MLMAFSWQKKKNSFDHELFCLLLPLLTFLYQFSIFIGTDERVLETSICFFFMSFVSFVFMSFIVTYVICMLCMLCSHFNSIHFVLQKRRSVTLTFMIRLLINFLINTWRDEVRCCLMKGFKEPLYASFLCHWNLVCFVHILIQYILFYKNIEV